MKLRDIFAKAIDRPIEGVIKADDMRSLRSEVEEYILTGEIEKKLEEFLEAYNGSTTANGAWISGLFGSGKSHLLKMLALLLENRDLDGASTLELFLPKCGDNALLAGALRKACSVPSKSILFNIDQKATIISKEQIDALLSVFVKVFDEMCGYYGKQGYVAQFERRLAANGIYDKFRAEFEKLAKIPWETGRGDVLLQKRNIDRAYCLASAQDGDAESGILDKYRKDYKVSIEDFAENVRQWLDMREPGFRLNFFVDEVGQYIDKNTRLMLNLQTIAESLATKCGGRAWIVVTSQEALEQVIGDMNARQGNDFSKIQARFKLRPSLTSQDVDEVIQKRLLAKNSDGSQLLAEMYDTAAGSLKTMFDFGDGSRGYKNFRDQEHFIGSWPFIPYQFQLFQESLRGLSAHNAFEGRHSSVGERSMLGVFQDVAKIIADLPPQSLAPFNLMFEGLRGALKSQIQKDILQAENSQVSQFALRVLKALFLVKYISHFKATVRNICVLLLEDMNQDIPVLKSNVENALAELENQTYIQRNDAVYEYLTDEEKDIEEEIKNTETDNAEIMKELSAHIFGRILGGTSKIRHHNGKDYAFAQKLDGQLYSRDHELAINVITPFNDNAGNHSILQMQNAGRSELLIILPPDNRLMRDITLYRQTEKYTRQSLSHGVTESVKRILEAKRAQNGQRQNALQRQIGEMLDNAEMYAGEAPLAIAVTDARSRINAAFSELLDRAYPNMRMLRDVDYSEKDIPMYLRTPDQGDLDPDTLSEAAGEMLNMITAKDRAGNRVTLKSLEDIFQSKPYGWYHAAIICILARLLASGKAEARQNGETLERSALEKAITNTSLYSSLVIVPQIQFSASQMRGLKSLYGDLFDDTPPNDQRELVASTRRALAAMSGEMEKVIAQKTQFPFLSRLEDAGKTIRECAGKTPEWYMTSFMAMRDELLAIKDELLEPARAFLHGAQKDIYCRAAEFLKTRKPDLAYLDGPEAADLAAILTSPDCFRGNAMIRARQLLESLDKKLAEKMAQALDKARAAVARRRQQFEQMPEFSVIDEARRNELLARFDQLENEFASQTLVAALENTSRRFEEEGFPALASRLCEMTGKNADKKPGLEENPDPYAVISIHKIRPDFEEPFLSRAEDVEKWLDAMRQKLLMEIGKGRKVQI